MELPNKDNCKIICDRIIENVKQQSLSNRINHPFDKKIIWDSFQNEFSVLFKKPFEYTNNYMKQNLAAIFYYFLENEMFFDCPNLFKEDIAPSFNKGLLLVGKVGIGKSDIMKGFESVFKTYRPHRFKMISVSKVVDHYEVIKTTHDRQEFFKYYTKGQILFDDLYSEKLASNYGKVNIMKEIIIRRYNNNCKTHFTMNPIAGYEDNPKENLLQMESFYGSRTVDRLFGMCNYVQINGKSRRV